jgi:peptide/nickel transport system ATP-binding protein
VNGASSVLEVAGLTVAYRGAERPAVAGVDLELAAGEVVALVGESGSGKTSIAFALLGLLPRGARVAARKLRCGEVDLTAPGAFARVRGREIALVSQDSGTSLDPRLAVGEQVSEGPRFHERLDARGARARASEALAAVGFERPEEIAARFPHELSGGMRQRALIAAALASRPRVLIADEPTSALDSVSRALVLALLRDLARSRGLALLLITHDLASAARAAERALVMQGGRVVESAPAREVFERPLDPYTIALVVAHRAIGARPRAREAGA